MSKRRMDIDHRANTLEDNKLVLRDLRTRNKVDQRSFQELNKLFAKLNSDASSKHSKNANISSGTRQEMTGLEYPYGPLEGFPVGSWWGIRMDCSRDGVHHPFNKDIQEGHFGAVSLCTSHLSTNNDVDLGDSLTFTGNKYEFDVQSSDPLLQSYHTQVPLRLVRSYNLSNDFAPKTGYRYDGLYVVATYWIGIMSEYERNYKFALIRVCNQDPPPWLGAGLHSKLAHHATKISGPHTRCNAEKRWANQSNDTHNLIKNELETSINNSRPRIEAIKFSFNKSSAANNRTEKVPFEEKKSLQESAIVTRCISNKKMEFSSSSGLNSVPHVELLVQSPVNRHIENCSKPPPCKLPNTNISIRTDLYESYLHQEPVKLTPMTFCRTFNKTARAPPHIVKYSNVGTLNLNSCGPCPKDKEQESQIQSRSGIVKFSSAQSPSLESNRSADRNTPKIVKASAAVTAEEKKSSHDQITREVNSEIDEAADNKKSIINDKPKGGKRLETKRRDKENSPEKVVNSIGKLSESVSEKSEPVCPITRKKFKERVEAASINRDESKEEEKLLKESHGSLDSLTPDQMLNFIVNQKYHPRAKLLIGSVIGLATGESTILRAYDSLISRQKRWKRSQSIRTMKLDSSSNAHSPNLVNTENNYECRQGSSGTARKTVSKKRIMKERMMQMRLRRTRVSKRSNGADKKSITKPSESMSQRLRKCKVTDKTQQPFSKSTILKKSAKRVKKRGGELARLVIDANIGPKIRGPRNRRLRGTRHVFSQTRRSTNDQDLRSCCSSQNSDVGLKGKKGNSRVELSSRRSKRLSSGAKPRIPQTRFIDREKIVQNSERNSQSRFTVERKQRVQENERINIDRNYRSETSTAKLEAKTSANAETSPLCSSSKGVKRNIQPTRSNGGEKESSLSGECSSKRSCYRARRENSKTRGTRMVDAATQCSDRRDVPTSSVEREIQQADQRENQENGIKVEWIDLDDVKSETPECVAEEPLDFVTERYASNNTVVTSQEDCEMQTRPKNVIPIRPQAAKPQVNFSQRLSAFVPVNLSDSDFRIARLRSIGFRPIDPAFLSIDKDPLSIQTAYHYDNCASGSSKENPENSNVASRVVDEQYNKYTSVETDVVEYMDQELRFQDIENEETGAARKSRGGKVGNNGPRIGGNKKNNKIEAIKSSGKVQTAKQSQRGSNSIDEDSETPWHGWKKFVKNKQAHFVGW